MMESIPYEGFWIDPAPYQLAETMKWKIQVYIRRDTGSAITSKYFIASDTFDTEEEAEYHSINFGKDIIDGKIPSCSVNDL
jgi:hypothetical protein